MLLFVSFLPKMCPQLLKARGLACSWLPSHGSDHVDALMPLPRDSARW